MMHYTNKRPDPSFLETLRIFDSELYPRWNHTRERWEIWRKGKYVMVVQTTDGQYCPLDNRVIQKLFLSDTHRYGNAIEFIRSLHIQDEKLTNMKRKDQDELIRAIVRDMQPVLKGRRSVTLGGSHAQGPNPSG